MAFQYFDENSTLDGYHEGCEITIRIGGENKQ